MSADPRVRPDSEPGGDEIMAVALNDLEQLGALGQNWDGLGSDPPTECAREAARSLLQLVSDRFWPTAGPSIEPFTVGALPGSGVLLDWRADGTSLEVDIGPRGELGYLFVDQRSGDRRAEEADAVPQATILDRLAVVFGSRPRVRVGRNRRR